jgi:hypothetical protein
MKVVTYNRRYETTHMVHPSLRRTSPIEHLADLLNLVVICETYVCETCCTHVICECW